MKKDKLADGKLEHGLTDGKLEQDLPENKRKLESADDIAGQKLADVRIEQMRQLVIPLLDWYAVFKRTLPWREDPNPYHVWISEIMLQQTRVEAVKGYYDRFMKSLPDIRSLANADDEKLLKLWEGLGYYSRVRNLKKAAIVVEAKYQGVLPDDYERLLDLPGIGSYTAGAISSIAYGKNEAAVDGNVLRVITRATADESDITKEIFKREMRDRIRRILPEGKAGIFNQALMDLGATVCLPNGAPLCERCPWKEICEARKQDKIFNIPVKPSKKERTIENKTVLIITFGQKVLLHKRGKTGLLAGMYEFPMMEEWQKEKAVLNHLNSFGIKALHIEKGPDARHIFSHKEWHMKSFCIRVDELQEMALPDDYFWVDFEMRKEHYPIPSAFAAYLPYIKETC